MIIRKSAIVVLLVGGGLIAAASYFTRSSWIEGLAEYGLSEVFKADVEIDGLSVQPFELKAEFKGITIADKDVPTRNLLQTGNGDLDLEFLPLLERKLIVESLTLQGIQAHTPRTGGVSKRKISDEPESSSNTLEELRAQLPKLDIETLTKKLNIDGLVNPSELESVKTIEAEKANAEVKIDAIQTRLDQQTISEKAKALEKEFAELDLSDSKDLQVQRENLQKLKALRDKVRALQAEAKQLKNETQADVKSIQNGIGNVDAQIDKDVEKVKQLANLGDMNVEEAAKLLFGDAVLSRFNELMGYYKQAKTFMDQSGEKEAEKETSKRREGRDIHFAVTKPALPSFLVRHTSFSGMNKGNQFSGDLKGLTSNARKYGKPTLLNMKFSTEKNAWNIDGEFDHAKLSKDILRIIGDGVSLPPISLAAAENSGLPSSMIPASSKVDMNLSIVEGKLDGALSFLAEQVEFEFNKALEGKKSEIQKQLKAVFQKFDAVDLTAALAGSVNSPNFSISSNLDKHLSGTLKKLFGEKVAAAEKKIRAEVNAQAKQKLESASKALGVKSESVVASLNEVISHPDKLDAKLDEAQKKIEDRIKEKADALKDKATDKAKDAVKDKLKSFF